MIVYDGEFISAEDGNEEKPFYTENVQVLIAMIRKMKDGDSLVINASEEDR